MKKIIRLAVEVITIISATTSLAEESKSYELDDLLAMNLSQLVQVQVSAGTFTKTSRAKVPAAVTRIDQEEIQQLGARSMLELLEIVVPGLQVVRHHYELPHIGVRGVISDREDKVMIRVNGRVMNERTARGAITERDFPLMKDIKQIDVIRGAGSSMYGLGAVSVVIDITTFDALSLKENSISAKGGAGLSFYAFDGNFAKNFKNGLGIYLNGEIADIEGADDKSAPLIFGADGYNNYTDDITPAGTAFTTESKEWRGFKGNPFYKAHLAMNYKNTSLWFRFTTGGREEAAEYSIITKPFEKNSNKEPISQIGYRQITGTVQHRHPLSDKFDLNWMLSLDNTNVEKLAPVFNPQWDIYHENELFAQMIANWHISPKSDISFGNEYSFERFFREETLGIWDQFTWSVLGEWQWRLHDYWTTFLGGRIDKNTYTEVLFSPRASLVFSRDNVNTYKLIYSQSQRMNIAKDSRKYEKNGDNVSDPEVLHSIEARYQYAKKSVLLGISAYYIDLDAIGWDQTEKRTYLLGNQMQGGAELEMELRLKRHLLNFSQAYTKLIDFQLYGTSTTITAEPFGYGNDLADWATHSSKLRYTYRPNQKLSFTSTFRAFWGYDGSRDFRDKFFDEGRPFVNENWEKAYKGQYYLNTGMRYAAPKHLKFSLDFYNLLGIFDKDLNKRIYRGSKGDYRSEAVAVGGGVAFNF